jgi:hypothetical protein
MASRNDAGDEQIFLRAIFEIIMKAIMYRNDINVLLTVSILRAGRVKLRNAFISKWKRREASATACPPISASCS